MTFSRRTLRGLVLSLAAVITVALALSTPAGASAAPSVRSDAPGLSTSSSAVDAVVSQGPASGERRYYWGVIAVSTDAAVGAAYNYRNKRQAKHRALIGCKERSNLPDTCKAVAIFANQCAALAVTQRASDGYITDGAVAFDRFRQHAKRQALRKLHRHTSGGHILYSLCSG